MYTPQSFIDALPSLVVRHGGATQLTLSGPVRVSASHITLSAIFANDNTITSPSTTTVNAPGQIACSELGRYVVQVAAEEDTMMHWCVAVQRTLCIAALLLSSSDRCYYSNCTSMSDAEPITRNDMAHSACAISRFHVYLMPYLPEMHWEGVSDGVLGSRHYTVLQRTLQATGRATNETHVMPGKRLREDNNKNSNSCNDASSCGPLHLPIRVAVLLNADVPTPRGRTECAACDAAYDGIRKHTKDTEAATITSSSSSMGVCDTTDTSKTARKQEMCIVVLHAPHARLFTRPSAALTADYVRCDRGVDQDVFDSDAMFDFVKAFTTHYVIPRVGLQVIQAQWAKADDDDNNNNDCDDAQNDRVKANTRRRQRQRGKADRSTAVPGNEPELRPTPVASDDVCGMGTLGTSYLCYTSVSSSASACTTSAAVRNVVFVLDVPPMVWRTLYTLHENEAVMTKAAKAERFSVAAAMGQAMQDVLVQLAADNVDLFSKSSCISANGSLIHRGQGSAAAEGKMGCAPEVMAESIARSLSHIIQRSRNAVFVREAERLLFCRPASTTTTTAQIDAPACLTSTRCSDIPLCHYTTDELQRAIVAQLREHM